MTLNRDFNPFANAEVRISKAQIETMRRLSRTLGADDAGKENPEDVPFDRYIDVWIAAMAMGVRNGAYVPVDGLERQRFIMGNIFQNDLDRIQLVMLVAIAHTEDAFVVGDVRKVLDIAEGYATGGLPLLVDAVESGHLSASRNLARALVKDLVPG